MPDSQSGEMVAVTIHRGSRYCSCTSHDTSMLPMRKTPLVHRTILSTLPTSRILHIHLLPSPIHLCLRVAHQRSSPGAQHVLATSSPSNKDYAEDTYPAPGLFTGRPQNTIEGSFILCDDRHQVQPPGMLVLTLARIPFPYRTAGQLHELWAHIRPALYSVKVTEQGRVTISQLRAWSVLCRPNHLTPWLQPLVVFSAFLGVGHVSVPCQTFLNVFPESRATFADSNHYIAAKSSSLQDGILQWMKTFASGPDES